MFKLINKISTEFTWQYEKQNSCLQSRLRYGRREYRMIHEGFSNWDYIQDGDCKQEQVCSRCGYKKTHEIHQYSAWHYVQNDDCQQERVCSRCEDTETRTVHEYSAWQNTANCGQTCTCRRCGHEKVCPSLHDYIYDRTEQVEHAGNDKYGMPIVDVETVEYYRCRVCGAVKTVTFEAERYNGFA